MHVVAPVHHAPPPDDIAQVLQKRGRRGAVDGTATTTADRRERMMAAREAAVAPAVGLGRQAPLTDRMAAVVASWGLDNGPDSLVERQRHGPSLVVRFMRAADAARLNLSGGA
jgi:hypothetical protein